MMHRKHNIRKGQVAVEFYSYLMFFLLVFAVAAWMYYDYMVKSTEQKQFDMIEQLATYYAMPIDMAVRFGHGYTGYFRPVESGLVNINSVSYREGFVILNWSSAVSPVNYYSHPLLTENVTHYMLDPMNCLRVMNINGTIIVTEISYPC